MCCDWKNEMLRDNKEMAKNRRIMLIVSYDGTNYSGWALQSSTPNTVEGVLNRAIHGLTGEEVAVIGASRTDAGVHAYGNVAVFDTNQGKKRICTGNDKRYHISIKWFGIGF